MRGLRERSGTSRYIGNRETQENSVSTAPLYAPLVWPLSIRLRHRGHIGPAHKHCVVYQPSCIYDCLVSSRLLHASERVEHCTEREEYCTIICFPGASRLDPLVLDAILLAVTLHCSTSSCAQTCPTRHRINLTSNHL